jgi:hypothetical protein
VYVELPQGFNNCAGTTTSSKLQGIFIIHHPCGIQHDSSLTALIDRLQASAVNISTRSELCEVHQEIWAALV